MHLPTHEDDAFSTAVENMHELEQHGADLARATRSLFGMQTRAQVASACPAALIRWLIETLHQ